MLTAILLAIVPLLTLGGAVGGQTRVSAEVRLRAADGVRVYGTYLGTGDRTRPTVLLFHMSDSNRGEYAAIAPQLVKLKFNTLCIDQRSGGMMWERENRTVRRLGRSTGYDEALPDLEAALAYVRATSPGSKILVWGSSYSSALALVLAAAHPDIAGVLAFSPNEYLFTMNVADAAAKIRVPVFISSARDEADTAKAIYDAVASPERVQFVPRGHGQHGSMAFYTPERDEYWAAVRRFLARYR